MAALLTDCFGGHPAGTQPDEAHEERSEKGDASAE